jgi:hypothetical protein
MTASHSPAAESRMLEAPVVSAEFFRVLGAHPLLGRDFLPVDERPGAHVAILSYALWQSTFGGARDIVGRAITLDGKSHVVVGVMPAGFVFPISGSVPLITDL